MKNKLFSSAIVLVFMLVFSHAAIAQSLSNAGSFQVYALDTIAGSSTSLKTSQLADSTNVIFEVQKPNGEEVQFSAIPNLSGVARIDFSDYYTRMSGDYTVSAYLQDMTMVAKPSTFKVYPGSVSYSNSSVTPENQVVHTLNDSASITVQLLDDYGNPVEGHLLKLLSSSDSASVNSSYPTSITDEYGEVSFDVSSDDAGTVVYTAYDVGSDLIISSRAKVAYFNSDSSILDGSIQYAAVGNGSGPFAGFEFDDLADSISPGDTVTFTVTAVDGASQHVLDYLGTVRLSAVGENAPYVNLPGDYTFTAQDLGSHTFSLSLGFQQAGTYEIEARDLDDTTIFVSQFFDVVEGTSSPSSSSSIVLTNPVSGTYSNNILVISGVADPGARLNVFDNNIELSSLIADISGEFSYTTPVLVDGLHQIYVVSVNEVGTLLDVSDSLDVTIDTSAPELDQVLVEPNEIAPGDITTVTLYTSDSLSQAALLIDDNIYDLSYSPQGFYEVSFVAPSIFGQYPVTFILVDELGNESRLEDEITIDVGAGSSEVLVGNVTNLTVEGADHRVILRWDEASSVAQIANYRVFYGDSPNQLVESIDTFTDSTTWYIPNLRNGMEYYFSVVAVDVNGNISEYFSNIAAATPESAVVDVLPPDVVNGSAGGEALDDMESDVSETGPDVLWLVLLSLIGGVFYGQTLKSRRALSQKRQNFDELG